MQTQQIRFRLHKDELAVLDELGSTVLSRQSVAAMLLSAAIAAVREQPGKLSFPPKFTIGEEVRTLQLNEPTKPRR